MNLFPKNILVLWMHFATGSRRASVNGTGLHLAGPSDILQSLGDHIFSRSKKHGGNKILLAGIIFIKPTFKLDYVFSLGSALIHEMAKY